jgi:hypothetical protein
MVRNWVARWLRNSSRPARRSASRRYRPTVEMLEDRSVPAISVTSLAQGVTADELVQTILAGGCGKNVTYTGASIAAGTFTGGDGIIGFNSGIILSTGSAAGVAGPNNSGNSGVNNGTPGDPQLTALAGVQTFNAAVLEFDFIPRVNQISFQYVFGSEEYLEFVGSQFNDVFGFFVNNVNVALIPNTMTPVAINTVNNITNTQFFINNSNGQFDTQMDGFTVVLTATATVIPNQLNHIKLAIADAGDAILDSWVLIQASSFLGLEPTGIFATGADAGGDPTVKVFNANTSTSIPISTFQPYGPFFRSGIRTAVGDVNGDGILDILTAPGPGVPSEVKVFSGATGQVLYDFFAFDPSYLGGIFIAAGDTNGDGFDDIIVGVETGSSEVKVFSGLTGQVLLNFFAYPGFAGGVRVGAGDVNLDGFDDIITGSGPGSPAHVKVFSGPAGVQAQSFFAYDAGFLGGIFVAGGDINNDGFDDVIVGVGLGGGSNIKVYNGPTNVLIRNFFAFAPGDAGFPKLPQVKPQILPTGGVRVGFTTVNCTPAILAGAGPGGAPVFKIFNGITTAVLQSEVLAYDFGFRNGIYISGA